MSRANVEIDTYRHVPAFELPISNFLGEETRQALKQSEVEGKTYADKTAPACTNVDSLSVEEVAEYRQSSAEVFYDSPLYTSMRKRYPVVIRSETLAEIPVEVFTPSGAPEDYRQDCVLINLHGGGFNDGARTLSQLESIPPSAIGRIKVISVDYRLYPEHSFPAASDDVVSVYRSLLSCYAAENIGLYGCSSGALLAAQVIARLQHANLAMPGAIAMACAAAHDYCAGDSAYIAEAVTGSATRTLPDRLYLSGSDFGSPLVLPGKSDEVLSSFPPSLLLTSTQDFCLSSVVHTHTQLVKLGVEARLHVWEGLRHGFLYDCNLPESREAFKILVNFFARHLGASKNSEINLST